MQRWTWKYQWKTDERSKRDIINELNTRSNA